MVNQTDQPKYTERIVQNKLQLEFENPAMYVIPNYTPPGWFECDVFTVSKAGYGAEFEIKLTKRDFHADFKKEKHVWTRSQGMHFKNKHDHLRARGHEHGPKFFWYVVPEGLISEIDVPDYAGLRYITPRWKSFIVRKAPQLHGAKVRQEVLNKIGRSFYYRYWNLRRKQK